MIVSYKNKSIQRICEDASFAKKKYGQRMAIIIQNRIRQITTFETVEIMIQYNIGRCHMLTGDRKHQYAVDLVHPYRLIFEKKDSEIQIANIIEIVDYHKK